MIVIFKNNANPEQVKQLCAGFEAQGLKIHNSEGEHTHLIGLIGDTSSVDIDLVRANDFVEDVKRVSEPYKRPTGNSIRRTPLWTWRDIRSAADISP